jgi:hypothetical protein
MVDLEAPIEARRREPLEHQPASTTWLEPQADEPVVWVEFARYGNLSQVSIVAGQLWAADVPALAHGVINAFNGCCHSVLYVPDKLAHRARWILSWEPLTEAELTFLATGELV